MTVAQAIQAPRRHAHQAGVAVIPATKQGDSQVAMEISRADSQVAMEISRADSQAAMEISRVDSQVAMEINLEASLAATTTESA